MVAGLVAVVDEQATELAALREEIVELRQQLAQHNGHSGAVRVASGVTRGRPGSRWRRRRSMSASITGRIAAALHRPRVSFTHNRAEPARRMVKLQMKISGSFRTVAVAERFAHVRDLLAALQPDPVSP